MLIELVVSMTIAPDQTSNRAAVVLAAGKGTRMKSELPKVAIPLAGIPMINHVLKSLVQSGIKHIIIIVGYKKEDVIQIIPSFEGVKIEFAEQLEQKGTAHALQCSQSILNHFQGSILVASGDMPLIRPETIERLFRTHHEQKNKATVLSAHNDHPKGYGRLVRGENGDLIEIVEEKDATDEIRKIKETNTGTYIFESPDIYEILHVIDSDNAQKEFYLPDAMSIFRNRGEQIGACKLDNPQEALGANSKEELQILEDIIQSNKVFVV